MSRRITKILLKSAAFFLAAGGLLFSCIAPAVPAERSGPTDNPVVRIIVEKSSRTMTLLKRDQEARNYRIALGRDPVGPKVMQGDNKTPEGLYFIDEKIRNSIYHRALHLTYPNLDDVERAESLGVQPGGGIMIHGMRDEQSWMGDVQYLFNWTNGCIALTNREIEEVWDLVALWTPVEIRP